MKTQFPTQSKFIRHAVIGLMLAGSAVMTVPAQASWFGHARNQARSWAHTQAQHIMHVQAPTPTPNNFSAGVAVSPANLVANVRHLSGMVNQIYQKFLQGLPIAQKMQEIHLKQNLMDNLDYLKDTRSDYNQFANNEAETFRSDLESVFENFSSINQEFLHKPALSESLDKVQNLVSKLPVSFLYVLHKAVGSQLQNMRDKIAVINSNIQALSPLPPIQDAIQDTQSFVTTACDPNHHRVLKKTFRVSLAIIKITASEIEFWADHVEEDAPRDLVVEGDAVGEGAGTTVSSNPAHVVLETLKFPAALITEVAENYDTLAGAVCE